MGEETLNRDTSFPRAALFVCSTGILREVLRAYASVVELDNLKKGTVVRYRIAILGQLFDIEQLCCVNRLMLLKTLYLGKNYQQYAYGNIDMFIIYMRVTIWTKHNVNFTDIVRVPQGQYFS